jgi:hypothetical protein
MGIVITIPADPAQAIRSRETDTQPTLQELQKIVDGYITQVPYWLDYMGTPCVAFCNEDGRAMQLPINPRATAFWYEKLGRPADNGDVLVGNVVLLVDLPDKDDDDA